MKKKSKNQIALEKSLRELMVMPTEEFRELKNKQNQPYNEFYNNEEEPTYIFSSEFLREI